MGVFFGDNLKVVQLVQKVQGSKLLREQSRDQAASSKRQAPSTKQPSIPIRLMAWTAMVKWLCPTICIGLGLGAVRDETTAAKCQNARSRRKFRQFRNPNAEIDFPAVAHPEIHLCHPLIVARESHSPAYTQRNTHTPPATQNFRLLELPCSCFFNKR